jgi:uncharacterized protein YbjT (DUF2867 family)
MNVLDTVLITGLTGKSGTWFLKRLIAEKVNLKEIKIRAIVRNSSNVDLIDKSGLSIEKVFGDLEDVSFLNESIRGVSTVFHITGIDKSLMLVQVAVDNNVRRIILVHTTGIYSKYKIASSGYIEVERRIEEIILNRNINLTILRPTMIYGSIKDNNVIVFIRMVNKLKFFPVVNYANYHLQPVYEKDLGDAYYQVLMNPEATKNKNYILSGKEPILLIDMLKIIGDYLGKKNTFISIPFPVAYFGAWIVYILSFRKMDYREKVQRLIEDRVFSHSEAAKDFGYSPVSFKEGVQNEIKQYTNT